MNPMVIKAAAAVAAEPKLRNAVMIIIVGLLTPLTAVLLITAAVFGYFDDTVNSGNNVEVATETDDKYMGFVQKTFKEIDDKISEKEKSNGYENRSLDTEYVRAVFFYLSPNLTESECRNFDTDAFLLCFDDDNLLENLAKLYPGTDIDEAELNELYGYMRGEKP